MRERRLGRTDLQVSVLSLGTVNFGPGVGFMKGISVDEAAAFPILDRALDAGITLYDTADTYQGGASEKILGRWMRDRGCRDRIVLATKVGGPTAAGQGLSPGHIAAACDASLRRLGCDVIDLYQAHWPDATVPLHETLEALDALKRAGKVRHIGCSNFPAWLLALSLGESRARDLAAFASLQPQYSLAVRHVERELLPLCRDQELGVITWGALCNGLLSGKYERGRWPANHGRLKMWRRRFAGQPAEEARAWDIIESLLDISSEREVVPAVVAQAWLLGRPGVTSLIMGARSVTQLEQSLTAADFALGPDELARLEAVSSLPADYPTTMMNRHLAGGEFWD